MDRLLTINEVAEITGTKPKTLRNWLSAKTFPYPITFVKKSIRVKESALQKYIDKRTVNQTL